MPAQPVAAYAALGLLIHFPVADQPGVRSSTGSCLFCKCGFPVLIKSSETFDTRLQFTPGIISSTPCVVTSSEDICVLWTSHPISLTHGVSNRMQVGMNDSGSMSKMAEGSS